MGVVRTVNPATGETLAEHTLMTPAEASRRVEAAREAQRAWSRAGLEERGALLLRVARRLRERKDEHARLMALEMGKPVAQGRAEVEKCAWASEVFAREAAGWLADEDVPTGASRSYVTLEPLGVVLGVMPWNFPFWQVFRCAAPALMAGNAIVVKHAAATTGCGLAIEEAFREAGAPDGLYAALVVDHATVSALIEAPAVRAVTLTGSAAAGRSVAAAAGRALKKVVLELGGSDAYIVLEDADLDHAARTCAAARLVNGGQSCVAAKRFLVAAGAREEFTERLVADLRARVMGDPLREDVDLGPLAQVALRDELAGQVRRSVAAGARLVLGGDVPDRPGAWHPATVVDGARPGMAVFDEEVFGPVAVVAAVKDAAEAVEMANASAYGLGAAVFTRDAARGERLARELEAGCCFVNGQVRSDPFLPFGGVKDSGFGRELGPWGMRELVNVKTVWIA